MISSWRNVWGSVENGASLDYLFSPDVKNDYKKSYTDVTGLFQLDNNGYYYYNMRRNFAEFREAESEDESNTFILTMLRQWTAPIYMMDAGVLATSFPLTVRLRFSRERRMESYTVMKPFKAIMQREHFGGTTIWE